MNKKYLILLASRGKNYFATVVEKLIKTVFPREEEFQILEQLYNRFNLKSYLIYFFMVNAC